MLTQNVKDGKTYHKFHLNQGETAQIKKLYDGEGKQTEGNFGTQYLYAIEVQGQRASFYATPALSKKMAPYTAGSVLFLSKGTGDKAPTEVTLVSGQADLSVITQTMAPPPPPAPKSEPAFSPSESMEKVRSKQIGWQNAQNCAAQSIAILASKLPDNIDKTDAILRMVRAVRDGLYLDFLKKHVGIQDAMIEQQTQERNEQSEQLAAEADAKFNPEYEGNF